MENTQAVSRAPRVPRVRIKKPNASKPNGTLRTTALSAVFALTCSPLFASPILTEIHYNGPKSGTDPDEFIELTNAGASNIDLSGWSFTQGLAYRFETGFEFIAGTSLVLARDIADFSAVFNNYAGELLDFSGALSNSGETLTLADADGLTVWSIRYDDSNPWPENADGLGDSLQLRPGSMDAGDPRNWESRLPSPGVWLSSPIIAAEVPLPGSITLFATGILLLCRRSGVRKRSP